MKTYNTISRKVNYETPRLEVVLLDSVISLALSSINDLPPTPDNEAFDTQGKNPYGTIKYNSLV